MKKLLPHICIVMGLMFMTLLIADQFNTAMGFITDPITKVLMMITWPIVIITCILYVRDQRRLQRARERAAAKARAEARRSQDGTQRK